MSVENKNPRQSGGSAGRARVRSRLRPNPLPTGADEQESFSASDSVIARRPGQAPVLPSRPVGRATEGGRRSQDAPAREARGKAKDSPASPETASPPAGKRKGASSRRDRDKEPEKTGGREEPPRRPSPGIKGRPDSKRSSDQRLRGGREPVTRTPPEDLNRGGTSPATGPGLAGPTGLPGAEHPGGEGFGLIGRWGFPGAEHPRGEGFSLIGRWGLIKSKRRREAVDKTTRGAKVNRAQKNNRSVELSLGAQPYPSTNRASRGASLGDRRAFPGDRSASLFASILRGYPHVLATGSSTWRAAHAPETASPGVAKGSHIESQEVREAARQGRIADTAGSRMRVSRAADTVVPRGLAEPLFPGEDAAAVEARSGEPSQPESAVEEAEAVRRFSSNATLDAILALLPQIPTDWNYLDQVIRDTLAVQPTIALTNLQEIVSENDIRYRLGEIARLFEFEGLFFTDPLAVESFTLFKADDRVKALDNNSDSSLFGYGILIGAVDHTIEVNSEPDNKVLISDIEVRVEIDAEERNAKGKKLDDLIARRQQLLVSLQERFNTNTFGLVIFVNREAMRHDSIMQQEAQADGVITMEIPISQDDILSHAERITGGKSRQKAESASAQEEPIIGVVWESEQ